ncbi:long-chain fatty acid--CoA ligase [Ramlibacter sp. USB13]|uniref:Long-chain fatty acid--CoA ligase n=1 Tax=Ramlibacter cellulosilyticus TaxID=2764187 RepID=A0A923MNW6_9BURK|nr:long-chain fatty acid--CoA ligase [Ramlibacter cellulosilyticus]MBC5782131.1 long-chain fatty acid--CoA ligase [Ramlibacter cellulosilyticus]
MSRSASADLASVRTLAELLQWRVAVTPHGEAYRQFDPARSAWSGVTWQVFGERVARFARALVALGLQRGDRVALLLPNTLDAVTVDQAVLALGCVPVPMHAIDNPASIAYILADSGATLLVADTKEQWQAIAATGAVPATLRHVVLRECDKTPEAGSPAVLSMDVWLARGETAAVAESLEGPGEEDLATLVYTSGTTGKPKGVMLTHRNVLANVKAIQQHLAPRADDLFLSFLPLSHTFERTCGYYLPIACGACVAFARSVQHLPEDMRTVRPTILVSVPRIYERVYAKVQAMLEASPAKHRLFAWAQAVGWRRFCRAQKLPLEQGGSALVDALAWPLLSRLVAKPLLAQFGGRLRVAVSGGAALSQPIAQTFLGLGLPIVQGYGMTESAPVVAANTPEDNDPATVGRPLPGVEVRIGENKELLVRGPNVMRGYWKREEDTARALADGWLHTGDQAAIENGRVRILGRVKEIIVTSTGEKIAPVDLEMAIVADPLFEQAYAFGDDRPFIACMVVLGREPWERLARGLGLDPADPASLQAPAAVHAALERIKELTKGFPYYAQPRAVALTLEPWTVENGLITPTLKLKRNNLVARYGDGIERLYRR